MQVKTTRFGVIEVERQLVIEMPAGMVGLERCKRFTLLEERPDSAYKWLQSLDDPAVAFVVVDPICFFPDYETELTDEQAEALDLQDPGDVVLLATVTVGRESDQITANLAGPIVVNARTLRAKQIVLEDERYSTKHIIARREPACAAAAAQR
jgi:flagellar assembly factor FliW